MRESLQAFHIWPRSRLAVLPLRGNPSQPQAARLALERIFQYLLADEDKFKIVE